MDEENETTRRNTNNEISSWIVKVIDWFSFFLRLFTHIEGGRGGRRGVGEGHRQVMLLLTLTDGEWHFVFTRRPCERSSASDGYIRDETDFPGRATFHSKTDTGIRTCLGSLILCTQRCLTPEKSVSYIVKIFFFIFFYCCPPLIHNLSSPERDLNTRERF